MKRSLSPYFHRAISVPIVASFVLVGLSYLATIAFAQTPANSSPSGTDDLFTWLGRLVVIIALIVIAAAAVFNTLRKAALNEYKELAEARKGKLVEAQLEIARKDARIAKLESDNEELEKKNLRLQE